MPQEVRDPMVREFRKDHLRAGRMHLGFFGTGASPKAHFDLLQKTLLPQLKSLIEDQRLKFTIYTWTNKRKAHEIERQVRALLPSYIPVIMNSDDTADGSWGVRIIYGNDRHDATRRMLLAVADIDCLITMLGERTAWAAFMPEIPLPAVNFNCRANTSMSVDRGYVRPVIVTSESVEYIAEQLKTGAIDMIARLDKAAEELPVEGAVEAAKIIQAYSACGTIYDHE